MVQRSTPKFALRFVLLLVLTTFSGTVISAQSIGSAGTISGVVTDPNGAVVPNAIVRIENPITGYTRMVNTNADGSYRFGDVPPNSYQMTVVATGFGTAQQAVSVRTSVPITLNITLTVGGINATEVTVTDTHNVLENVPTTHTDVDQTLISRLSGRSPGSGLSDVVTLAAPGVVADSNGFFHPLGDHAQTSYSIRQYRN